MRIYSSRERSLSTMLLPIRVYVTALFLSLGLSTVRNNMGFIAVNSTAVINNSNHSIIENPQCKVFCLVLCVIHDYVALS